MDKFLTFEGQQPIYLGDIDYMQDCVKGALLHLFQGLTGQEDPKVILREATESQDGVVFTNGEILPYKYEFHGMAGNLVMGIQSTYSGDRTLKDGSRCQCYEHRYAKSDYGPKESPDSLSNYQDIGELFRNNLRYQGGRQVGSDSTGTLGLDIGSYSMASNAHMITLSIKGLQSGSVSGKIVDLKLYHEGQLLPTGTYYTTMVIETGGTFNVVPIKFAITSSGNVQITIPQIQVTTSTTGYCYIIFTVYYANN